jgi:hypothetical protein
MVMVRVSGLVVRVWRWGGLALHRRFHRYLCNRTLVLTTRRRLVEGMLFAFMRLVEGEALFTSMGSMRLLLDNTCITSFRRVECSW